MTRASRDLIEMSFSIDNMKKTIPSLDKGMAEISFESQEFSLLPLFYLSNLFFGDIYEMENETISRFIKGNNGDRIKVLTSVLPHGQVWVNVFAFNAFVEAANCIDINMASVVPYDADEIAWGLVCLAGIEGALTIPIKNDVLKYIKASLDYDGWDMPPLFLMFKNIEDLYDGKDQIESIKSKLGEMSINDIVNLSDFSGMGIDDRPDLQNYIFRNQEFCLKIQKKSKKFLSDWTSSVGGAVDL